MMEGGGTLSIYFFFQAEDGIRDWSVTGVQTCALPISATPAWTVKRQHAHRRHSRKPAGQGTPGKGLSFRFSKFLSTFPQSFHSLAGRIGSRGATLCYPPDRGFHYQGKRPGGHFEASCVHGNSPFHGGPPRAPRSAFLDGPSAEGTGLCALVA